jgi:glucose/arabinose dehydrogenase
LPGDFRRPVDIRDAGGGRLFVVEQIGTIRVMTSNGVLPDPFLDLRDRVGISANEQGLLGLALHPDYASNGRFFVNYTDLDGDTVISRFQVSAEPNRADPSSETAILQIDQPFPNHNGGGLAFGPDGYLYIGMGDGGSGGDPRGNAQSLDTLLGKMLRINVDGAEPYTTPPDNPFPSRPEIWAYGLRNPWRFSFDPLTHDLYIADVGQNVWEEVNFQPAGALGGANYGWNILEGTHEYEGGATEGLTPPVAEYSHDGNCSVTGGVVVRDPALPELMGVYLYGDYCSGLIWGLVRDSGGAWQSALLFQTGLNVSTFGQGVAGEVYLADHEGALYRLERAAAQ